MQHRLAESGTSAALSTIQRHCTRHGFARLHPGCLIYSPTLARMWAVGDLSISDLKTRGLNHNNKHKQQNQ